MCWVCVTCVFTFLFKKHSKNYRAMWTSLLLAHLFPVKISPSSITSAIVTIAQLSPSVNLALEMSNVLISSSHTELSSKYFIFMNNETMNFFQDYNHLVENLILFQNGRKSLSLILFCSEVMLISSVSCFYVQPTGHCALTLRMRCIFWKWSKFWPKFSLNRQTSNGIYGNSVGLKLA